MEQVVQAETNRDQENDDDSDQHLCLLLASVHYATHPRSRDSRLGNH